MWTGKTIDKKFVRGDTQIIVEYTNGVDTFQETVAVASISNLNQTLVNRINGLNSGEQAITDLVLGTVDITPTPVVTPTPPTQAQIDQQQWLKDYQLWIKVKSTLVDTGIVPITQTQVAALKTKVISNLKAEYINLI